MSREKRKKRFLNERSVMKIYLIIAFLATPGLALAYLDPGSGNALVYLVVSLAGASLYFVKGLFYKVQSFFGKKPREVSAEGADVILFSEGPAYWFTFKPLIEELLSRKIPFQYMTLSVDDPALRIDNPLMQSKFMGYGAAAYARIANAKGKLFIATTPNIGTEGYPIARPKNVAKMVFIAHMVSDISYLKKGSLDHYDVDLEVGSWCEPRLRQVEKKRGLKPKEVHAVGLLYLDELLKGYTPKEGFSEPLTVLVAPSWGVKGCLSVHGIGFIAELLKAGFKVILRPHPQSFIAEPELINRIVEENATYPNFSLDQERDARISMKKADILISDSSSFRFDFAFLTKRSVITLAVPAKNLSTFEADELGGPWDVDAVPKLGAIVNPGDKVNLPQFVRDLVEKPTGASEALYDELVANHGTSAQSIVNWIEKELALE